MSTSTAVLCVHAHDTESLTRTLHKIYTKLVTTRPLEYVREGFATKGSGIEFGSPNEATNQALN